MNVDTRVGTTGTILQKLEFIYDAVGNVKPLMNNVNAPSTNPPAGTLFPWRTIQSFNYDELHELKNGERRRHRSAERWHAIVHAGDDLRRDREHQEQEADDDADGGVELQLDLYVLDDAAARSNRHRPPDGGVQHQRQPNIVDGITEDARTLVWDEEDRLKSVTYKALQYRPLLYGGDGERSHKQTPTSQTYYINPNYVVRAGTQTTKHITIGAERIASVVTPSSGTATTFFYHADHLQSTGYVTDAQARITQHNEYYPHGEVMVDSPPLARARPICSTPEEQRREQALLLRRPLLRPALEHVGQRGSILSSYMKGGVGGASPKDLGLYSYC